MYNVYTIYLSTIIIIILTQYIGGRSWREQGHTTLGPKKTLAGFSCSHKKYQIYNIQCTLCRYLWEACMSSKNLTYSTYKYTMKKTHLYLHRSIPWKKNPTFIYSNFCIPKCLSLIHIWRCRRYAVCRSRWSPYH